MTLRAADMVETVDVYGERSYYVIIPTGGTSGYFGLYEDALQYARELYPELKEDA